MFCDVLLIDSSLGISEPAVVVAALYRGPGCHLYECILVAVWKGVGLHPLRCRGGTAVHFVSVEGCVLICYTWHAHTDLLPPAVWRDTQTCAFLTREHKGRNCDDAIKVCVCGCGWYRQTDTKCSAGCFSNCEISVEKLTFQDNLMFYSGLWRDTYV